MECPLSGEAPSSTSCVLTKHFLQMALWKNSEVQVQSNKDPGGTCKKQPTSRSSGFYSMCLPQAHSIRRDFSPLSIRLVMPRVNRGRGAISSAGQQVSVIYKHQLSVNNLWSTFSYHIQWRLCGWSLANYLICFPPSRHFRTTISPTKILACLTCLGICFSEDPD